MSRNVATLVDAPLSVTADFYVHIMEATQRRAMEELDALLGDEENLTDDDTPESDGTADAK